MNLKHLKNLTRRALAPTLLTGLACGAYLVAAPALADTYPSKPIRMVIGFPAGQASDVLARYFAGKLSEELKASVFVDNRVGATGMIAHEYVKNVEPDGYTLLMTSGAPLAINPALYKKVPYDPVKDFAPVILTNTTPMFLGTVPSTPVNNLGDMKAWVAEKRGAANYGSGGNGVTTHIVMESLKAATQMDIAHIPYKGSPAMLVDLIAGRVDFGFETSTAILPHVAAGRLKLLGVTSAQRSPAAPNVPTMQEQGLAGFEALTWAGIVAPARTPPEILNKLNAALNVILKKPDVIAYFQSIGGNVEGGSTQDFGKFIAKEVALWGKAVKISGATVD